MRIVLLGAVVALVACGGHRAATPACTLHPAGAPVPETGEHTVAFTTSCAFSSFPPVRLFGLHGRPLAFTYVFEGGARRAHTVVLDKYRCDVRSRDLAHTLALGGGHLDLGRSLLDWCPAQGVSTVVHVYLGGLRRARATWREVFHDVYDGRLDRVWPCGALRTAITHLPADGPIYSKLPEQLARAAAPACEGALRRISPGAPRFAVEDALGPPSSGGERCELWRWAPGSSTVDGARVCFRAGRATLVQTAVHG
jgi:hypothetical protein